VLLLPVLLPLLPLVIISYHVESVSNKGTHNAKYEAKASAECRTQLLLLYCNLKLRASG
jgi:hypothetical protein